MNNNQNNKLQPKSLIEIYDEFNIVINTLRDHTEFLEVLKIVDQLDAKYLRQQHCEYLIKINEQLRVLEYINQRTSDWLEKDFVEQPLDINDPPDIQVIVRIAAEVKQKIEAGYGNMMLPIQ